jgi:hypothetical protein
VSPARSFVNGWDVTIVNPAGLEPFLCDSVCEHCHLKGHRRVSHAGGREEDFRVELLIHRLEPSYRDRTVVPKFDSSDRSTRCTRAIVSLPVGDGLAASHATIRIIFLLLRRRLNASGIAGPSATPKADVALNKALA